MSLAKSIPLPTTITSMSLFLRFKIRSLTKPPTRYTSFPLNSASIEIVSIIEIFIFLNKSFIKL